MKTSCQTSEVEDMIKHFKYFVLNIKKYIYNKNYMRVGGEQWEMEYPRYWFQKIF